MTRTWVALLPAAPADADRATPVEVEGEGPAVLVTWTGKHHPHPQARAIDPRLVGEDGPDMSASWVELNDDEQPLFDAPEVLEARRTLLRQWPDYGASTLVSDSVRLAGSVLLGPAGSRFDDDPFARFGSRKRLRTSGMFVSVPAPTGPALERYAGAPWPYDRFDS